MSETSRSKITVAIGGGQCTGKSTLAASLFSDLKIKGFDYDLIAEENRKLKKEFGNYQSVFERFYMWRQQEREELRSTALDGFITDTPLFQIYAGARMHAQGPRDFMAVRELARMCFESVPRYSIITLARDPSELPYKTDTCRSAEKSSRDKRHDLIRSFVEHYWPEKLLLLDGSLEKRIGQIEERLEQLRAAN